MNLEIINEPERAVVIERLRRCCASARWADAMAHGRPYSSLQELTTKSDAAFRSLTHADLEEAMAAHPRIGERPAGTDIEAKWSRREQAAMSEADQPVEAALRAGNAAYEDRFGHVFVICASGRTAQEMLGALRQRLGNDRQTEWSVIANELRKITALRLERLVQS